MQQGIVLDKKYPLLLKYSSLKSEQFDARDSSGKQAIAGTRLNGPQKS